MRAAISLTISILLFGAAIYAGFIAYQFARRALVAPGEVVETPYGGSHPSIRFTSAQGEAVTYVQQGLIAGYKPGDAVRVLYDPANPKRSAIVDSFAARWTIPMLLCFGGLITLLTGLSSLATTGRK